MCWVLLGHYMVFQFKNCLNQKDMYEDVLQLWSYDFINNAVFSCDTFLAMSGLLTAYVTVIGMEKRKSWRINWADFYFHRFWRLTPPYMAVILLAQGLIRFCGKGPLWPTSDPAYTRYCGDRWWTNLLYVNNFLGMGQQCFGHGWYLAVDMQLYVLSPLLLVSLYKHRSLGLALCAACLLASWTYNGVTSTMNGWVPGSVNNIHGDLNDKHFYWEHYYSKPWCRCGPFVVGVLAGFALAKHRGRLELSRTANTLGWALSAFVFLSAVYGIRGDVSGNSPSSVGVAALYNASARTAWGAAVCWVVVSCALGWGGAVNSFLSWPPFVCLGRLTYMVYLIHPSLNLVYLQSRDALVYYDRLSMAVSYVGVLVLVNMVAFVLMLALESPMRGLEKAITVTR